ncbi:D-lyxose/D-mannose family sugar isomerase [Alkalibacterium olivapovliticus]|uniref:D-lyxose ketol-isomerase n=1 Tax=Alkalibacterium olivapovliticus TaxID=99907 RepID=A0A2T0VUQ9_9LACT|nr:D-lyxose/D-mannose family sugar isomerase [Alkalibacterium olivapovliticus]PRY75079.1 hypothetical protein CLV38_1374 [Alkalibacterium olivapovliticus]
MKRSEINKAITEAVNFFNRYSFKLPGFSHWTPIDWESKGSDYDEIRENGLGWDVTDFGSGQFSKKGLLLFTLRNGSQDEDRTSKSYAEKIMVVKEEQVTPYHYHWKKTEDIINRGGGELAIRLYMSDEHDKFSDKSFSASSDGRQIMCDPGELIVLSPGESITLTPKLYHSFWALKGSGDVLVGEVSESNDDSRDNRFYDEGPRFSEVDEDEPKKYLLVNEYK